MRKKTSFDLTVPQLQKLEEQLKDFPEQIPAVAVRAINRAAEASRSAVSKFVREEYFIGASNLTGRIKIKKAYQADMVADIYAKDRTISSINFKVRANKPLPKKGSYAHLRVKKSSSGGMVKGSFITTVRGRHRNVFTRVTKNRFPLRSLHSPSVPQMMGHEDGIRVMEETAREVLEKRLEHEVERVLKQ
ncbi:phage tail protein [Desulfitobacterium chlororespirans]|uniref:Prophage minor tail protein Z (GPZ) n=1 Tax=Desulfitobacterium chlororespirans DSM 11544 TaxID=1121395 RepID=A0A1M7U2J8_9FIRM|nr:phage tail protein [Desulfitobacterium chlororespirans]SHN77271.1 Prophage minor tail protein Z (GPZ) [Desulfitobacterium chlororespirans DSM 11544]